MKICATNVSTAVRNNECAHQVEEAPTDAPTNVCQKPPLKPSLPHSAKRRPMKKPYRVFEKPIRQLLLALLDRNG